MTGNLRELKVEAVTNTFIATPFKPTLEWYIHGLNENLGSRGRSPDFIGVQNHDVGEFVTQIDVDHETQRNITKATLNTIRESTAAPANCLMKLACNINIVDITRRLLTTAVESCDLGIKVDEDSVYTMAHKLAEAMHCPLEQRGSSVDSVIFSLVPAIAVQRETGRVMAYAVGQLVARGKKNAQMTMVVRGFAPSAESRQIIIESVSQSLLPISEVSI